MRFVINTLFVICLLGGSFNACAEEPAVTARLLVSNPAPYIGEEINLLLEVSYNSHPGGRTRFSWPKLDDFISADLTETHSQRSRNERNRLVETVSRRIRPLKSGTVSLHQAIVSIGSQNVPIQPLTLRVKSLPVMSKPDRFNNQIGTYRLILAAEGTGPREISLHIYDSNNLAPIPELLSLPKIGKRLIPLDTETKPTEGNGREHILRYYYIPAEVDTGGLRFSLITFDPEQQSYREIETEPAQNTGPLSQTIIFISVISLFSIGLVIFRLNRYPRMITGCLEKLCQRPVAGLSRERILTLLHRYLDPEGQETLKRYWQNEDALRFNAIAATGETGVRMRAETLRRHLCKGIDKQRDNP